MTDNTEPTIDDIEQEITNIFITIDNYGTDEEARVDIRKLISDQVAKAEALLINNIDNALDDIEGTASGRYYPFMDTKSRLSTIQEIANELKQRN